MKTFRAILLSAALAMLTVSVAPTASADTCAVYDQTLEDLVCPPVLGVYCTVYWVVEKHDLVGCALRAIPKLPVLP